MEQIIRPIEEETVTSMPHTIRMPRFRMRTPRMLRRALGLEDKTLFAPSPTIVHCHLCGSPQAARACALLSERHFLPPRRHTTLCDLLTAVDHERASQAIDELPQLQVVALRRYARLFRASNGGPSIMLNRII